MLNKWLNYKQRAPAPYPSVHIIDISEIANPNEDVKNYIAGALSEYYRNADFLKQQFENENLDKLTKDIEDYVFPTDTGIAGLTLCGNKNKIIQTKCHVIDG